MRSPENGGDELDCNTLDSRAVAEAEMLKAISDTHKTVERIFRSMRDPWWPAKEFDSLKHLMVSAWRTHIAQGVKDAEHYAKGYSGPPTQGEINGIIGKIRAHVNARAFIKSDFRTKASRYITSAYHRAGREVDAEFAKHKRKADDSVFNVDVVDGMSEFEAINTLADQIFIAAGDFWDSQLQDSIKAELEEYLQGDTKRTDFTEALKKIVNDRLTSEGRDTLGDSYFQRLAHHAIVRTRTIGKFAQAKKLGATKYKLVNPLDRRTGHICRTLVERGTIYTMASAQGVVNDLLNAKTTAELKQTQPFWKSPDEDRTPIPPLHWGDCRTTMRPIFI